MSRRVNLTKDGVRLTHLALAALALALVLGLIAFGIVLTHDQSKGQLEKNFKARGVTSAQFVSSYLAQQADREALTAKRFLAGRRALRAEFSRTVSTFGSDAAVLLDHSGRVLAVAPTAPALLGSRIATRYPHLSAAESGHVAVSGVVRSAAQGRPVVAIAVPYGTREGRRVLSVAYPVASSVLSTFVEHTIATKPHLVLLIDATGKVVADSPDMAGGTLRERAPALASALARRSHGSVRLAGVASTFVSAPVVGTTWRLLIAVPNEKLFVSIVGPAQWLPWVVFAVIAMLALAVLGFYSRSIVAHDRLKALSHELAAAARSDALTGLANRRSLEERMGEAWAYANRHQELLSALMIDFDHFKQINDSCGHAAGDELLRAVADCMRSVFRGSDIFGRWGGDEFLAILVSTDPDGARVAAERLCDEVEAIEVAGYGLSKPLTISIGCASGLGTPPQELIREADELLYQAKREGRSRVAGAVPAPME
jgi:diguanylate cyclase (GGDEF)-like protein